MLTHEKELIEAIKKQNEIIVFGAGLCGTVLVRYLIAKGYADRIFCVAVSDTRGNPEEIMGVPVCSLMELKEHGSKAFALIAAFPKLHEEMRGTLKEHGFRNVAALGKVCYAEIRRVCFDYSAETYSDTRKIQAEIHRTHCETNERINDLAYRIAEQQEIVAMNTAAFEEYLNLHAGREIVLVATGSTLNDYKPIEGAVHVGVNTAYRYEKVCLDYHFSQDYQREYFCLVNGKEKYDAYINGIINIKCKKFIGHYSQDSPVKYIEISQSDFNQMAATRYFVDNEPSETIYPDIRFHPLMCFFSIVFPAMHFALFTNPRRIYLVGCDLIAEGKYKHFDGTEVRAEEWLLNNYEFIKNTAWPKVKEFATRCYPDTEIVSVNPVGLKGLFRDIYTK
ncbi:MAG: hypothetical protein LBP30_08675 [Clostridiales Family XIII bacterium]|jgi:hypothetical protein|nr:hypothetical protein [Clostridiales Family XIII bacterium]